MEDRATLKSNLRRRQRPAFGRRPRQPRLRPRGHLPPPAGVVATSVGTGAVGTYIGKQWVSAAQEAECRDAIATGQVLEHCTAHVAADHFWTEYYKNADCPNHNRDNCIKMVCEAANYFIR